MDDIKGIYYVGTWVVVIVGWVVVNQQNNRREERKEVKAAMGDIVELTDEITLKAIQYHKDAIHSDELSKLIRLQLQRLGFRIQHLHFHDDKLNKAIYEYRNSITYKNFDSSKHLPMPDDSEIIEDIHHASDSLMHSLEDCFGRRFRQGFRIAIAEEIRRFKMILSR
ncbi:hypothetical protein HGO40_11205 [Pseudomonas sp. CG7]|uniref:hypothetical protein n=1 Tax=Pseudomonas sp. CG7 TaxID=191007 RepID=UPI002033308A|nr:hypothetical protein [Pseudomonas sp. CG7]MCM2461047.1 hypothetical protein [Pseudomonas sp. CG7]